MSDTCSDFVNPQAQKYLIKLDSVHNIMSYCENYCCIKLQTMLFFSLAQCNYSPIQSTCICTENVNILWNEILGILHDKMCRQGCVVLNGSDNELVITQIPNVLFFQEMLCYQDGFCKHYADSLDGCGLQQESVVRASFYNLIRKITDTYHKYHRIQMEKWVFESMEFVHELSSFFFF